MDVDGTDPLRPLDPPLQGLSIHRRVGSSGILLSVRGELDLRTVPLLRTALVKALVEHPAAVLVDLTDMLLEDEPAIAVFHTAIRHSLSAPASQLVLICPDPQARATLARLSVPRFVPVVAGMDEALAAIPAAPRRMAVTSLGVGDAMTGAARNFVENTCKDWTICPEVTETAVLIADELVLNAVVHAGDAERLRLEAGPRYLTIAVNDPDPNPPVVTLPNDEVDAGHGVHLIDQLATAWGVTPANGGKTVWAALRIEPDDQRRSRPRRAPVPAARRSATKSAPRRRSAASAVTLGVYDEIVQRLTATALALHETLPQSDSPLVRERLEDALADLNQTVRRTQAAAYELTMLDKKPPRS